MGMIIDFKHKMLNWDGDKISLKINGTIQDKNVCKMLYSLHTNAPILKEVEDEQKSTLTRLWLMTFTSTRI